MGLLSPSFACLPDLSADLSHVDDPRVLAVSAWPVEVEPGETVTLAALVAGASGTVDDAALTWSLCAARRPLTELGPIHRDCLDDDAVLEPLGQGVEVDAKIPDDVCRRFGPDPPPATADHPAGRPVDPDITGGYYQPILVASPDGTRALYQTRVRCGVAGATQAQAAELRKRYKDNLGPEIAAITSEGVDIGDGWAVAAGERVALQVRWAACPDAPTCGDDTCTLDENIETCAKDCTATFGCPGAEVYLRFDPVDLDLVTTREAMRVSWYATAGSFAAASTGRAAADAEPSSDNVWTAPVAGGPATLWAVLRDDRGGTGWKAVVIEVEK